MVQKVKDKSKYLSRSIIDNFSEHYILGEQKDDVRIYVDETTIDAPDYTEGEKKWQQSTLYIEDVKRSDDGLYECQAVNTGGQYFQSGHIAVEFPPTFEDQVITKEWSWDQRSVNLSCLGKLKRE